VAARIGSTRLRGGIGGSGSRLVLVWVLDNRESEDTEDKANCGYSLPMALNSIPDSHRDLLTAEFATLATVGEDGYPQLSEVWFLAQGEQVAVSLNTARQKTKNLLTEPACTLLILDLANPYRYVEIRGTAVVERDDDLEFARQVGAKYGADLREHDTPGDRRVIVRIAPLRVRAVDMGA
jgi:PPOX class probable F420-dependent enzyme